MGKNRHKVVLAVYLLLMRDSKILFMLRHNTGYMDGFYSLPSGHLEPGETLKEAMLREAQEEIGVALSVDDITLVQILERPDAQDVPRMDFFFVARKEGADPVNCEPHKCAGFRWMDFDEAQNSPVADYLKPELQKIKQKYCTAIIF